MFSYYYVEKNQRITETNKKNFNWLHMDGHNVDKIDQVIQQFDLPEDIFVGNDSPEEVSQIKHLDGEVLIDPISIVLIDLIDSDEKIEKRLVPISFVLSEKVLITCTNGTEHKPEYFERLFKEYGEKFDTFEKIIAYAIFNIYGHFIKELGKIKDEIDELEQAARKTTKSEALFRQTELERELVYVDHTLQDQKHMLDGLWEKEEFMEKVASDDLIYDIQLRQRQAEKMMAIYRDLLESIGSLFSSMMSNKLNHLMKYLDSASLIIAVPAMIAGIWGMNTGVPGEGSDAGFFMVVAVALFLAAVIAIHLIRKDYTK
ncbi:magnesium transporter CorA family protein [Listeria costaricensis]|uniref:magnesium transporter CorA family protein n=1 Tax=Listeria costaricensis TaxID=2026604 RepID=UPI000C079894|nr:magnesium transporter CorA family protein [Listeria costaricensis]